MSSQPPRGPEDEYIDPADYLAAADQRPRNAADDEVYSVEPLNLPPRVQPAVPPPPPPASASAESEQADTLDPFYCCLACGYPLEPSSGYRCSECGQDHDRETLERWFETAEPARFERAVWLCAACLFLKLWAPIPGFSHIARFLQIALAGTACYYAAEGKTESGPGFLGLLAALACLPLLCLSGSENLISYIGVDSAIGAALLIVMLSDSKKTPVFRRMPHKLIAIVVLAASPIATFGLLTLHKLVPTLAQFNGIEPIEAFGLLINLGVWSWVTWTIRSVQQRLQGSDALS